MSNKWDRKTESEKETNREWVNGDCYHTIVVQCHHLTVARSPGLKYVRVLTLSTLQCPFIVAIIVMYGYNDKEPLFVFNL